MRARPGRGVLGLMVLDDLWALRGLAAAFLGQVMQKINTNMVITSKMRTFFLKLDSAFPEHHIKYHIFHILIFVGNTPDHILSEHSKLRAVHTMKLTTPVYQK